MNGSEVSDLRMETQRHPYSLILEKTYSEVSPTVSNGSYFQARMHRTAAFIVELALEHVERAKYL